eukprot:COSAG01_NODE_31150_length_602_cov_39.180915_2_plen_142_part_01
MATSEKSPGVGAFPQSFEDEKVAHAAAGAAFQSFEGEENAQATDKKGVLHRLHLDHLDDQLGAARKFFSRKKHDESNVEPRIKVANETWRRLFSMIDNNRDHSLQERELKTGLQVVENAFQKLAQIYPVSNVDFLKNELSTS